MVKKTTQKTKTAAKRTEARKTATKRPATKKAAEKVATKRASVKAVAQQGAVVASPEQAFWVCDGTVLHSLTDLADAFADMSKATYTHHVTKDKHDFANWVELVLHDAATADALRSAKTVTAAKRAVSTRVPKRARA